MKILVTGAAGFIGYHTVLSLLKIGHEVVGMDNLNDYYNVSLKRARLHASGIDVQKISYGEPFTSKLHNAYKFIQCDLTDITKLSSIFRSLQFDKVINLAAQVGVRYSITNPSSYINSNIVGFNNILECCKDNNIKHLIYASSSSVYGDSVSFPSKESDNTDNPISLYAATKKADELMASCYSHLFDIATTGLRFFTVYGPWGRPDMAPLLFAKAIDEKQPIKLYNNGKMFRDFTYVDDIVNGIITVAEHPSHVKKRAIYNIGTSKPIALFDFVRVLENVMGKTAIKNMYPMQPGDVVKTYADTSALEKDYGYKPTTSLELGLSKMIEWYNEYKHLL